MSIAPRAAAVARLRACLLRYHDPRSEMARVLLFTGLIGFLTSAALLRLGLDPMVLRYPIAALVGYLAFLALVWRLVRSYRQRADAEMVALSRTSLGAPPNRDTLDPSGLNLDLGTDAEGCLIVAVIAAVCGLTIVAGYFVVTAPTLFAEIVLDSLLVGGLYRRIRRPEQEEWFSRALQRTFVPASIAIVLLMLLGLAFWAYAPDASSIGGVLDKWRAAH